MSETSSCFVDPVFLARFGLSRVNVLDYFLHPLNPFRTKVNTSNEILAMQGINIGMFLQQGIVIPGGPPGGLGVPGAGSTGGGLEPLTPQAAEEEYANALAQMTGEQYELMIPPHILSPPAPLTNNYNCDNEENNTALTANAIDDVTPAAAVAPAPITAVEFFNKPSALFTIRHVLRTNPTSIKVLGIYYIVEGVIYKAPSVRSLMKTNVTKTLEGLLGAGQALSVCARFQPSTGYTWHFEAAHAAASKDNHPNQRRAIIPTRTNNTRKI